MRGFSLSAMIIDNQSRGQAVAAPLIWHPRDPFLARLAPKAPCSDPGWPSGCLSTGYRGTIPTHLASSWPSGTSTRHRPPPASPASQARHTPHHPSVMLVWQGARWHRWPRVRYMTSRCTAGAGDSAVQGQYETRAPHG